MGFADGTDPISNTEDVIDSRDVIARIEYLTEYAGHAEVCKADCRGNLGDDEREELAALRALADEASDYAADWEYGETLIRDSYFVEYAEQLADDLGLLPSEMAWPLSYVDWERAAAELRMNYTSVDFDGVTYWVR